MGAGLRMRQGAVFHGSPPWLFAGSHGAALDDTSKHSTCLLNSELGKVAYQGNRCFDVFVPYLPHSSSSFRELKH